jgi:hypothetical protein
LFLILSLDFAAAVAAVVVVVRGGGVGGDVVEDDNTFLLLLLLVFPLQVTNFLVESVMRGAKFCYPD